MYQLIEHPLYMYRSIEADIFSCVLFFGYPSMLYSFNTNGAGAHFVQK